MPYHPCPPCPDCHAARRWQVLPGGGINAVCGRCGRKGCFDNLSPEDAMLTYPHLHLKPLSRGGYEVWAGTVLLGLGWPDLEWLPQAEPEPGPAGEARRSHVPLQSQPVLTLPCCVSLAGRGEVLAESLTLEAAVVAAEGVEGKDWYHVAVIGADGLAVVKRWP